MQSAGKVLIVDDDPMSRELLELLLGAEGFDMTSVESGEAAVEAVLAGQEEIVLVDMRMPGLCGPALATRLRSVAGGSRLLLAMSASQPDAEKLVGFDGFLLKPFDGADFRAVIENAGQVAAVSAAEFSSAGGEALDPAKYKKLAASMKPEQLQELYRVCLQDSRRRMEQIRAMHGRGDDAGFRSEAHAVKGACGMIGALRLAEIAAGMEREGVREGNWIDATMTEFLRECDVLEGMLIEMQLETGEYRGPGKP